MRDHYSISTTLAAALAALIALPTAGAAQSIGLHGGVNTLTGDDYEGADAGFNLGADVMFFESGPWTFGVEGDFSNFKVDETDLEMRFWDVKAKGRWTAEGEKARFFVGGSAGYTKLTTDAPTDDVEAAADGFVVGPEAGVVLALNERVHLEVGAVGMYHSLGEQDVDDVTVPDSDSETFRVEGRVGVRIPLGN